MTSVKDHSRSQTMTLLFKNALFLMFVLLIDAAEYYERKKFDL